ncbi:FG-GAP repeat domain-containing protein [Streptomyces sp. NPDC059740]|uniref:FG-GAP repeat domain-containing protein n=1 Tax=Streptomyces sp. NPDC059740 TaxID=3346926 RepID=UPI0036549A90
MSTTSARPAGRRRSGRTALTVLAAAVALAAGAAAGTPAVAAGAPHTGTPRPAPRHTAPDAPAPALAHRHRAAAAPDRTAAGGSPRAAATAASSRFDVDSDGWTDPLFRDLDDNLYDLHTSDASVAPYDVPGYTGTLPKDVLAPGDLTGDGQNDLLVLTQDGTLALHPQKSAQGSRAAVWSGSGWQAYNKLFAPGDVTGDGRADLLARTPDGDLYLYPGTGSVSAPFASRTAVGGGWSAYDQLVGLGDTDGDGLGDVAARTPGGDLYLYRGTGKPAAPLAARAAVGGGWQTYNQLLSADDWDGDGLADLMARDYQGVLWFYSADGKGNFTARQQLGTGWTSAQFANAGGVPAWGRRELVGLDRKGTLYWYGGMGDGQLSARQQASDTGGFAGAKLTYASSLDPEGYADLLELYNGTLYNYNSPAGGGELASGWPNYPLVLGPGDLTGDGHGDLLARDSSGVLWLYPGRGDGASLAARTKVGGGWDAYNSLVGSGDFTGDGRTDIVARTPAGTLYLYPGTGRAAVPFLAKVKLGTGWQQYGQLVSPGDLDGDGRADLLGANSAGTLYRYSSYGSGQFRARVKLGTGWDTYLRLF